MNPAQYGDSFGSRYSGGGTGYGFGQSNAQDGYSAISIGSTYGGGGMSSIGSGYDESSNQGGYDATDTSDGYSTTNTNGVYDGGGVNGSYGESSSDAEGDYYPNGYDEADPYESGAGDTYNDPSAMDGAPSGSGAVPRQPRFPHPQKSRFDVENLTSYMGGSGTDGESFMNGMGGKQSVDEMSRGQSMDEMSGGQSMDGMDGTTPTGNY